MSMNELPVLALPDGYGEDIYSVFYDRVKDTLLRQAVCAAQQALGCHGKSLPNGKKIATSTSVIDRKNVML